MWSDFYIELNGKIQKNLDKTLSKGQSLESVISWKALFAKSAFSPFFSTFSKKRRKNGEKAEKRDKSVKKSLKKQKRVKKLEKQKKFSSSAGIEPATLRFKRASKAPSTRKCPCVEGAFEFCLRQTPSKFDETKVRVNLFFIFLNVFPTLLSSYSSDFHIFTVFFTFFLEKGEKTVKKRAL